MDLLSSGGDALTMGKVPCEFQTNWPNFIFQGKVETKGLAAIACRGRGLVHGQRLRTRFGTFSLHTHSFQGGGGMDLPSSWGCFPHHHPPGPL